MVGRIEYGPGRTGGEALFVPRRRPSSKLHGAVLPVPARCRCAASLLTQLAAVRLLWAIQVQPLP